MQAKTTRWKFWRAADLLVIVAYMNLAGTAMEQVRPPDPRGVCGLVIRARELMPQSQTSLGCARRAGRKRAGNFIAAGWHQPNGPALA